MSDLGDKLRTGLCVSGMIIAYPLFLGVGTGRAIMKEDYREFLGYMGDINQGILNGLEELAFRDPSLENEWLSWN